MGAHCPLCEDGNVGRITPQCVLQPRRDGSWWIRIQLPPPLGTKPAVFYRPLPGSPSGMEPQFSHSGDLFIDTPLTGVTSFLVLLLHALTVLPVMSPNKLTVPEFLSPGLLEGPGGIQTEAGGFGKEPSWDLEHPLCCLPPSTPPLIQTHIYDRRDVRRRCWAGGGSWLPVVTKMTFFLCF